MKKKILKWLGLYTEANLVSFGNYVLSNERARTLIHADMNKIVNDSDLVNWKIETKKS